MKSNAKRNDNFATKVVIAENLERRSCGLKRLKK